MCLTYTVLLWELEHLKIETRLIGESFECVMGECVLEVLGIIVVVHRDIICFSRLFMSSRIKKEKDQKERKVPLR